MRNLKLTIEYLGTDFHGWQIQPPPQRTIQGEICQAAQTLLSQPIKLVGSGRTDSGVHARGQVANFQTLSTLPLDEIRDALNALTPKAIAIPHIEEVPMEFHAQYSAIRKTYGYRIYRRKIPCPFHRSTALHIPYALDIALMRDEAEVLVGKHDFRSFMATDSALTPQTLREKNTTRTIHRLDISQQGDILDIEIEADGFLYKMVRNIVGTLLTIAARKNPRGSMKLILGRTDRHYAGQTAPAHGLTLKKVTYPS
jgi:tRNA pseudouridine38-40 synthase